MKPLRIARGTLGLAALALAAGCASDPIDSASSTTERAPTAIASVGSGFDQYGYNRNARIFNGTYSSWCLQRGALADCVGIYSADKLLMKWNSEWDRGNAEKWAYPPYAAWLNNETNGTAPDASGSVWHYKFQWVGSCGMRRDLFRRQVAHEMEFRVGSRKR